jgi:hypothetical protein
MKPKREINKTLMGVIVVIVMLGSLALILFAPEVSVLAKVIFVAAFLGIGWLLLWSKLDRHFKQSLGREMRAPAKTASSSLAKQRESLSAKPRGTPAHSFTYQVFDVHRKSAGSSEAERLLKQGYKYYHHCVLNFVICALFLWAAFLILSFSNALLLGESLSLNVLCGSMLLLLAGFVLAAPRRYLTTFTFSVWLGLNLLFLVPIIYFAIKGLVQGLAGPSQFGGLVVFFLAGGIIVVYGSLFFILASALRRQVSANQPLTLLFLWVFSSAVNVKSTMIGVRSIWRFLGPMQFLRGGDLTVDMRDLVRKQRTDLVVDTPEELERTLKAFRYTPSWLGMYAENTLLCGDAVWKSAVHAFLRNADVVVMNLFGFSKSNQGCLYELGLLCDTFPIKRMLFLVDDTTDLDFLLATINRSWNNMSVDSPNYSDASASVQIYQMGDLMERLTKTELPEPRQNPLSPFLRLVTTAQSEAAHEADRMLRLILEGIVC